MVSSGGRYTVRIVESEAERRHDGSMQPRLFQAETMHQSIVAATGTPSLRRKRKLLAMSPTAVAVVSMLDWRALPSEVDLVWSRSELSERAPPSQRAIAILRGGFAASRPARSDAAPCTPSSHVGAVGVPLRGRVLRALAGAADAANFARQLGFGEVPRRTTNLRQGHPVSGSSATAGPTSLACAWRPSTSPSRVTT